MFYAIGISDRFTVLPAGLVLAVLIITGCGSDSKQEDIEVIEEPLALEISPVEVKALLDNQADFFVRL